MKLTVNPFCIVAVLKVDEVRGAQNHKRRKMNFGSVQNAVVSTTFQTPLSHIVTCNNTETLLVTDSVRCDGRFVLYTVVAEALNNNKSSTLAVATTTSATVSVESNHAKSRVLWISCTSVIDESILNALKKIGLERDVISSTSRSKLNPTEFDGCERLRIHSIASSLAEATILETNDFDDFTFMKKLFALIKEFVSEQNKNSTKVPTIVAIDDISALSVLVGERLAYSLILSLNALKLNEMHPFGLVIRCSNDYDIDASGLAGRGLVENADLIATTNVPWERSLVELADSIVDVTLLSSGYSRDVHGRLTISRRAAEASNTGLYNFCLTDNQVLLMRLAT